jgi:mono/diheme cytochrome c family protein
MKNSFAVVVAGAFVATVFLTTTGAQSTLTIVQGVYTADQAKRGQSLYAEQCAACHGDDLMGSGPMPALAGNDFIKNWEGKSVGDLFEKTHSSMPASAPGTLSEQQTADVLAYMFSVGKFPTGSAELAAKMEPLMQIKIEAAKP